MEIKVETQESHNPNEQKAPLLKDISTPETDETSLVLKAIQNTFRSTAHLANLLPTGTALAFQPLSSIFTNQGNCDSVARSLAAGLITLSAISCFLLTFTDRFKDKNGNVRHGFATFHGLWVIDGSAKLPPEEAVKYRVRFIDFMHAFMMVLVFAAVALFDQNVKSCFYPAPSYETQKLLTALPIGIGVICSTLFVVFPTKRHGIGFPLSTK